MCPAHDQPGLPSARNTGLRLESGEYVAYLDDDHKWKPERIASGVDRFRSLMPSQRERTAVVYCAVESRVEEKVASIIPPENEGNLAEAIRRDGLSTLQSSFLFRRTGLESVGGFDERLVSRSTMTSGCP